MTHNIHISSYVLNQLSVDSSSIDLVEFSVNATRLLFSGFFGIVLLLILIVKFKVHTVLSLLLSSLFIGISSGMPVDLLVATIERGAGKTLQNQDGSVPIVLLIGLGSMFGGIIEASGGAKSISQTLISKFGEDKSSITLGLTGLIFGTIVFFEVGVMILIPLAFTLAKKTKKSSLYYAIPLLAGLASGFAFIPPSTGTILVADILQVDLGIMILVGVPTGIVSLMLAGIVFSKFVSDKIYAPVPDYIGEIDNNENVVLPDYRIVITIILIPLFLILSSTLTNYTSFFDPIKEIVLFLGTPFVALLVTIMIALYLLGVKQGYNSDQLKIILDKSLRPTAGILLVITGGSIVSEVLQVCGMGNIVTKALELSGLPLILLAFLIAVTIRVCVGAALVSMTITAGIISSMPMIEMLPSIQLACIVLAINSGATAFSHFNDSGFWLASSLLGIDEQSTIKTWTFMETIIGFTGLCCALILSIFA